MLKFVNIIVKNFMLVCIMIKKNKAQQHVPVLLPCYDLNLIANAGLANFKKTRCIATLKSFLDLLGKRNFTIGFSFYESL
jgi:hypothetical protein